MHSERRGRTEKKLLLHIRKAPGSSLVSVSVYSPIPTFGREGKLRNLPETIAGNLAELRLAYLPDKIIEMCPTLECQRKLTNSSVHNEQNRVVDVLPKHLEQY